MEIERLDNIEKQIKPLIEPFIKITDKLDYLPFGIDKYIEAESVCYTCKYSLAFYDDIDIICCCGFAGNEHLCPFIQEKCGIKINSFDNTKEQIREILK